MWLWSGRIIVPRPKTGGIDCSELLRTASNSSNSEASTFNLLAVSEGIVTVQQQRPKCWCCSFLYLMIVWKWIFKQPYPWNMRSCLMWQNPGLLSTFTYHQKLDLVKSWKQSCRDAYAQGILYSIYLVVYTTCTRHAYMSMQEAFSRSISTADTVRTRSSWMTRGISGYPYCM